MAVSVFPAPSTGPTPPVNKSIRYTSANTAVEYTFSLPVGTYRVRAYRFNGTVTPVGAIQFYDSAGLAGLSSQNLNETDTGNTLDFSEVIVQLTAAVGLVRINLNAAAIIEFVEFPDTSATVAPAGPSTATSITTTGNFTIAASRVLVVGGGGGGGGKSDGGPSITNGGGGGSGYLATGTLSAGTYSAVIGAGGSGGGAGAVGGDGGQSSFSTIVAAGGKGGSSDVTGSSRGGDGGSSGAGGAGQFGTAGGFAGGSGGGNNPGTPSAMPNPRFGPASVAPAAGAAGGFYAGGGIANAWANGASAAANTGGGGAAGVNNAGNGGRNGGNGGSGVIWVLGV
ncbi:MAG: hypothetical protein EBS38_08775 [Actinobacteria bacterium]|nr:hypothetical protein [Actinomycetota bacterium]